MQNNDPAKKGQKACWGDWRAAIYLARKNFLELNQSHSNQLQRKRMINNVKVLKL